MEFISGEVSSDSAITYVTETVDRQNNSNRSSPVSNEQQIVIASIIALLAVWSIVGNCLTILAITLHKQMLTKCNLFILSLALSDFFSAAIASPLWLYRRTWGFYHWRWGEFLCKLFWFVDESTSYCTSLHIASYAAWRFYGVRWPRKFERTKISLVASYLVLLWILSLIFGGFLFTLFYELIKKPMNHSSVCWPMCSIRLSHNGIESHLIYYTFSSTTFMLFPMFVLFVASVLIVRELSQNHIRKNDHRKDQERKATFQLALIATSFLIGYIPMTSYVMWTTRGPTKSINQCSLDYWYHVAAYLCMRLSECINPLVYNIACKKMRKASKDVIWRIWTCCRYKNKSVQQYSKEAKKFIRTKSISPKFHSRKHLGTPTPKRRSHDDQRTNMNLLKLNHSL